MLLTCSSSANIVILPHAFYCFVLSLVQVLQDRQELAEDHGASARDPGRGQLLRGRRVPAPDPPPPPGAARALPEVAHR